jgi:cell division transport system ATP-binding protein
MISCQHVTKSYPGGFTALNDIDFELSQGKMAFLTGHSGAGKSTLLRLIALIERATRGKMIINGFDLSKVSGHHLPYFRRSVGVIFQDHRLLMDRTVFDNVALPLVIAGFSHYEIKKRVQAALDKVGLLNKISRFPVALSGGEQQRVGIARAVVNKPSLLLADEPTGNLDPVISADVMRLFSEFNQVGVTVLIASHDLDLISKMSYPVFVLEDGRLCKDK